MTTRPCPECGEPMKNTHHDEDDNRVRTLDVCAIHGEYIGCLAKRLSADGESAWGDPGTQYLSKFSREGAQR